MTLFRAAGAKVSVIGGDAKGGGCRPTLTVSSDEQGNLWGHLFSVLSLNGVVGASLTLQGFDMVLNKMSRALIVQGAGPLKLVWVSVYQGDGGNSGAVEIRDTVATITGGTFDGNLNGGVITAFSYPGPFSYDSLTITGATFINNQVGGSVGNVTGCLHMTDCICFLAPWAHLYQPPTSLQLLMLTHSPTHPPTHPPGCIVYCQGGYGGALSMRQIRTRIVNCNFTGNTATEYGGAIFSYMGSASGTKPLLSVKGTAFIDNQVSRRACKLQALDEILCNPHSPRLNCSIACCC